MEVGGSYIRGGWRRAGPIYRLQLCWDLYTGGGCDGSYIWAAPACVLSYIRPTAGMRPIPYTGSGSDGRWVLYSGGRCDGVQPALTTLTIAWHIYGHRYRAGRDCISMALWHGTVALGGGCTMV
jgi:hypothetical protein